MLRLCNSTISASQLRRSQRQSRRRTVADHNLEGVSPIHNSEDLSHTPLPLHSDIISISILHTEHFRATLLCTLAVLFMYLCYPTVQCSRCNEYCHLRLEGRPVWMAKLQSIFGRVPRMGYANLPKSPSTISMQQVL
jgi:hypothetical protein